MIVFFIGLVLSVTSDIHSDNGMFHASVNYLGGTELITQSFMLHDQYGDVLYTKTDLLVNTFFICNKGTVFAQNERLLCFYHPDGRETVLKELVYPNGAGFSPDNSLFFVSDRDGIFTYSHEGVLVSTYRPGRLFACSEGGQSVAVISADTLFVYCHGDLMDTENLSSPYVRDVYFSAGTESFVIRLQGNIEVYDMNTGTLVKTK